MALHALRLRRFPLAGLMLAGLLAMSGTLQAESSYETLLKERRIDISQSGLKTYLQDLHPTDDQSERVNRLIEQMGSTESFATREKAMTALISFPGLPVELLQKAARSNDAEIRWRAKEVLETSGEESRAILFAVYRVVADNQIQGLVPELMASLPLCDKGHLMWAAQQAIIATVSRDDADELRKGLEQEQPEIRRMIASALVSALEKDALPDLEKLQDDPSEQVRFTVAVERVNLGDRKALPLLRDLLSAEEPTVRSMAHAVLRYLSGEEYEFPAYGNLDERRKGIAKWTEWIAKNQETAELKLPVNLHAATGSNLNGNMLLAFGYSNKVSEYDPSGKEIWTYPAQGAWCAEKLVNGNVLIAAHTEHRVIEVDHEGKVVWEYKINYPIAARPLPNGNVLVAAFSPGKVQEVNRDGKVEWELSSTASVYDAHKLANGNIMYTAGGSTIEITPDKKEVWKYSGNSEAYGIYPMEDGNVLICESQGRVIEVNRDKTIIWEFAEGAPSDAYRLPNGNTLITGNSRFVEVTPDKKVVWSLGGCNYGTARK